MAINGIKETQDCLNKSEFLNSFISWKSIETITKIISIISSDEYFNSVLKTIPQISWKSCLKYEFNDSLDKFIKGWFSEYYEEDVEEYYKDLLEISYDKNKLAFLCYMFEWVDFDYEKYTPLINYIAEDIINYINDCQDYFIYLEQTRPTDLTPEKEIKIPKFLEEIKLLEPLSDSEFYKILKWLEKDIYLLCPTRIWKTEFTEIIRCYDLINLDKTELNSIERESIKKTINFVLNKKDNFDEDDITKFWFYVDEVIKSKVDFSKKYISCVEELNFAWVYWLPARVIAFVRSNYLQMDDDKILSFLWTCLQKIKEGKF